LYPLKIKAFSVPEKDYIFCAKMGRVRKKDVFRFPFESVFAHFECIWHPFAANARKRAFSLKSGEDDD
jgi:hypothetical protein